MGDMMFDSINRRQPSPPKLPTHLQQQQQQPMIVSRRKHPKQERFSLLLPQITISNNNGGRGVGGTYHVFTARIKKLMLVAAGE